MSDAAFQLDDWRAEVVGRRAIEIKAVLEATRPGNSIEPVLTQLRRAIGYSNLGKADQRLFITMASQLRTICGNWSRLDENTKVRFERGLIPYSAVYKLVSGR